MPRGPLPNPQRRRTNAPTIPTTQLPVEGRKGPAPKCPYTLGKAGRAWWRWAWKLPQATAWDAGCLFGLARRAQLEDVLVDDRASAPVMREMRELDNRFGLNAKAMADLRWSIAAPQETPVRIAEVRTLRAVDARAPAAS